MEKNVMVQNATGLHARPASQFVNTASKFKSEIFITKNGNKINAKSIMGVLAAGISKGTNLTIEATGADEGEALEALVDLINSKFGER